MTVKTTKRAANRIKTTTRLENSKASRPIATISPQHCDRLLSAFVMELPKLSSCFICIISAVTTRVSMHCWPTFRKPLFGHVSTQCRCLCFEFDRRVSNKIPSLLLSGFCGNQWRHKVFNWSKTCLRRQRIGVWVPHRVELECFSSHKHSRNCHTPARFDRCRY